MEIATNKPKVTTMNGLREIRDMNGTRSLRLLAPPDKAERFRLQRDRYRDALRKLVADPSNPQLLKNAQAVLDGDGLPVRLHGVEENR